MSLLHRRQGIGSTQPSDPTGDTYANDWWYSSTAYAIKWAVIAAIFILFLVFFLGGYWHARRRMSKGLAPLSYHRFIIPRRRLTAFYAAHPHLPEAQRFHYNQQFSFYRPGYGDSRAASNVDGNAPAYHMGPYGQQQPPPPAYGHEDHVPAYTPPQGGSKMDPDQNYMAPSGPPPAGVVAVGGGQGQASGTQHAGGDLGSR